MTRQRDLAAVGDEHAADHERRGPCCLGRAWLSAQPRRRPLLEERAQAFLAFGRDALVGDRVDGQREHVGGPPAVDVAEQRLRRGHGRRRGLPEQLHVALDREVEPLGARRPRGRGRSPARGRRRSARRSGTARARPRAPILRTTYGEIIAGRMPSTTSVNPKTASSAATTTSQTAASPEPPPSAAPWIAADDRHGQRSSA